MENKAQNYLLAVCAVIETVFFAALLALPVDDFIKIVSYPDTGSYLRIARELADSGALIASHRTLGYPAFMAIGYLIGGDGHGNYWIIGGQLLLNLLFTLGCWKLIPRIAPKAPAGVRVALTAFFFWAGLGMALKLLTDFLAAFLFAVFLSGLLFWRRGLSLFVSATALALATLVRPTFTFVPLLIPIAAYLVGRCTSKIPALHVVVFIFASLSATGISSMYQYSFQGYAGPSPVLTQNIGRTLQVIASGRDDGSGVDQEAFNRRIAQRAGKPFSEVTPTEEQKYAVEFLLAEFKERPGIMIARLTRTAVKYLFAPVDSATIKLARLFDPKRTTPSWLRIVLGVICLPVWILAILPPLNAPRNQQAYYLLVMLLAAYVFGLTSINPFLGERIRFPVLVFMLPVAAINLAQLRARHWPWKRRSDRAEAVDP